MKYVVTYCGIAEGGSSESLERHLDGVMDALMELEEADPCLSDADLSARVADRTAEFSITVECDEVEDAAHKGLSTIRTAIHAADGATPGWESDAQALVIEFTGSRMRDALTPA